MAEEDLGLTFKERLDKFFGPSFWAVSEADTLQFMAVLKVQEERPDGTVIAYMFPDPGKNFYMEISSVEEKDDEWLVSLPHQRWAFRKVSPEDASGFAKEIKEAGVDV